MRRVIVIVVLSLAAGRLAPAQGPASPSTASETARLAEGLKLLEQGDIARAAPLANRLLAEFPNSSAALALALDVDIARAGAMAALDTYERWLGAKALENGQALRRVARAALREAARTQQSPSARLEALQALALEGDPDVAAQLTAGAGGDADTGQLAALGDEKAITALIAELQNPAGNRRGAIAGLVTSRNRRANRPLISALTDPNPDIRASAAEGLGTLNATEAIAPLKALLSDPVFTVHFKAAAALFRMNDPSGLSWLRQLETNEHAAIRLIAAQATATRPDGTWLALVRSLLADDDPEVRREAAQLIAPHDSDAAKAALRPLLTHANPAEREAATRSFVQFVDDDLASLRRFLRTGDAETRVRAAARILELTR